MNLKRKKHQRKKKSRRRKSPKKMRLPKSPLKTSQSLKPTRKSANVKIQSGAKKWIIKTILMLKSNLRNSEVKKRQPRRVKMKQKRRWRMSRKLLQSKLLYHQ